MNIDGYEIGEIAYLRRGGPLWAAQDMQGRHVLISFHAPHEGELLEMRWRQWAGIDSPHVVSLLDVVRHEDGRWALVQERVEGESLALLLADGGMREKLSRHRVYQGICEGIEALHRAGMVHGDLSPQNIIVTAEQRAVIIDLCDDPEALAGTEGWSRAENPSKEADIDAVEKIRDALLVAEGSGEIPDPATRLRLHASLPTTEIRVPSHQFERVRRVLRGQRHAKDRTRPSSSVRKLSRTKRRRSRPAALLVITSVFVVGAGWVFAMANRSSAGGPGLEASQSALEAQYSGNMWSPGLQQSADHPHSEQAANGGNTGMHEDCVAEEISGRVIQILNARDEAFNNGTADGLDAYLAGELLAADSATILKMGEQDIHVSDFHTVMSALSIHQCDAQGAQVELTVAQSQHQRCIGDSCTQMPEERAHQVLLDLQGAELKGIRTQ